METPGDQGWARFPPRSAVGRADCGPCTTNCPRSFAGSSFLGLTDNSSLPLSPCPPCVRDSGMHPSPLQQALLSSLSNSLPRGWILPLYSPQLAGVLAARKRVDGPRAPPDISSCQANLLGFHLGPHPAPRPRPQTLPLSGSAPQSPAFLWGSAWVSSCFCRESPQPGRTKQFQDHGFHFRSL